jgi:nucleotide-binding universal stress UspA family protein
MDRIVVGVDGSAASTAAAVWAAGEAAMRNVELTIVHVLAVSSEWASQTQQPIEQLPTHLRDAVIWQGKKIIDDAVSMVAKANRSREPLRLGSRLCVGPLVPTLWGFTQEGAQLIVLGRHDRSDKHPARLGSVMGAILDSSRCPVAIVPHVPVSRLQNNRAPVVVGVDESCASQLAVAAAFDEAARRAAELVAVHAVGHAGTSADAHAVGHAIGRGAGNVFMHALADWQERYRDVPVRRLVASDYPVQALLDYSRNAQLVVVGATRWGSFVGRRWGGVSLAVARSCSIPMIVARRKPFEGRAETYGDMRKAETFDGFR